MKKPKHDQELRRAAEAARRDNQYLRLFNPDGELLERRSREAHYHIMYDSVVHWAVAFETQQLAFKEVKRLGDESEPNTEWYEEGPVLIETTLPGRTGLHRVLLQVVPCYREKCKNEAKIFHKVETPAL